MISTRGLSSRRVPERVRRIVAAYAKARQNQPLQPTIGAVTAALMNRAFSPVEGGRLDITPKWDDIQIRVIIWSA